MRPMAHELSHSQSQHGDVPLGAGSPNVRVHNGKAWRAAQDEFVCPQHGKEKVPGGHTRVLVNNKQATRVGDFLLGAGPPDQIIGDNRVMLGEDGVGLESAEGMKEWCKAWCKLEADWPNLTPAERRQSYEDMVGHTFEAFGAPAPTVVFVPPQDLGNGQKKYTGGYINVVSGEFGVGDQYFDAAKPGDLRRVTFHETRHGEQLFMGIRYARQQARAGHPIPGDNTADKNGALITAADKMQDLPAGSREEAFARTMAEGYSRDVGLEQLGWANDDYDHRYRQIPGGSDANRVENLPNKGCAC